MKTKEIEPCAEEPGADSSVIHSPQEQAIRQYQLVNRILEVISTELDFQKAVNFILASIGQALHANRCYVFSVSPDFKYCDNTFEWTSRPELAEISRLQRVPLDDFSEFIDRLRKFDVLIINDIDNPPENLRLAALRLKPQHIRSIYGVGLWDHGELTGFLGVDFVDETFTFSPSVLQMLANAVKLFKLARDRDFRIRLIEQQNQELRQAVKDAQAADHAKSMFLASMSHEIRTPLNAVIGFAELLRDGTLPEAERKDYLNGISSSGNALLSLINDVLDLSKLDAGQMVFSPAPVDLNELLGDVGRIFQQKFREKKLNLFIDIAKGAPLVSVDKLRMRQILFNLVGNAVKFTDSGSVSVSADFTRESERNGTLRIRVADTGIGIAKEEQSRIFEMFVQAGDIRRCCKGRQGTGLGLAICKRMVEKMNGELLLQSSPGRGSEFTVLLHGVAEAAETPVVTKEEESLNEIAVKPLTVLVADDVVLNLRVMSAMLQKIGMRVMTAGNAEDAWHLLEQNVVDYFLTDLWMPGMNGAELASKIRHSGKFPALRIAAVTADTESGDNFDMSLFDAVLTKPVTIVKLRSLLLAGL